MGVLDGIARAATRIGIGFGMRGPVFLRSISTTGNYRDPQTGANRQAFEDIPIRVVVSAYKDDEIDGSVVVGGDRRVLIEAASVLNAAGDPVDPKQGDEIHGIQGRPMRIVSIPKRVVSGDDAPLFIVQARG